MTDFEKHFAEHLNKEDDDFLRDLESGQGFFSQLWFTFRGPLGWVSILALVFALIFVSLAIWFAWEAFHATADRDVILWCSGMIICVMANALLRIWLLNRMSHLVVLRELKRIELRLTKLDEKLA